MIIAQTTSSAFLFSPVDICLLILIVVSIGFLSYKKSKGEKNSTPKPPSMIVYLLAGWGGCFFAAVALFSKMLGSWAEPGSDSAYAFYGFLSLVPGLIIGILIYQQKKRDYEKRINQTQKFSSGTEKHLDQDGGNNTKKCPYCGETILAVAKKCKHCGEWIKEADVVVEVKKKTCPVCGEKIPANATVCPICCEKI